MICIFKIRRLGRPGKMNYIFFSSESFTKILSNEDIEPIQKQKIILSMLRINILTSIQKAGSGHLGTSMSVLEIMLTALMYLKNFPSDESHFFSSKGHDAPALYACYEALGMMKKYSIKNLRRINGPPGHPDIKIENVLFNTGSLGMGISKANGWISAGDYKSLNSRMIIVIGDGEFQEGQNFESLMYLQNNKNINPLIIMDNNGIQSDTWVNKVKSYKNLKKKIESFNIEYKEINGHDLDELNQLYLQHFSKKIKSPTFVCANTIKGKGITFAESTEFDDNLELYPYHAGAMNVNDYNMGLKTLIENHEKICKEFYSIKKPVPIVEKAITPTEKSIKKNNILESYKKLSLDYFKKSSINVALNADLLKDAGSIEISRNLKNQFFEFGIAEQDMVSFASGLSSRDLIPWCHSFACFLTTRAQEQIFNFCSERRKGFFIGALAGPVPAGPGHSHQMLRDLALMGSMPFMKVFEPISPRMLKEFFKYQEKFYNPYFIRISNNDILIDEYEELSLPSLGDLVEIKPITTKTKKVLIIQGAILLHEFCKIKNNINSDDEIAVYASVWLNDISSNFVKRLNLMNIYVYQTTINLGGFGSQLSLQLAENNIQTKSFKEISIKNLPECGSNEEVLEYHGLNSDSILRDLRG